jgi:hypothetical protein
LNSPEERIQPAFAEIISGAGLNIWNFPAPENSYAMKEQIIFFVK